MAEERDYPTFSLCSSDQSACLLTGPTRQSRGVSAVSTADFGDSEDRKLSKKGNGSSLSEEDQRVDLSKYGLPEAITKLNQALPGTLENVIKSSVENILSQITAESEIHWRLREEKWNPGDGGERAKEAGRGVDKGKGVNRMITRSTTAEGSNSSSEPFDARLVPTPPPSEEAISFPTTEKASPATGSDLELASDTAAATEMDLTAGPRENRSHTVNTSPSSSTNPRKWQLLRTVFRRLSDTDPYLGLLRHHSTGDQHHSDLRSRLKKTKGVFHLGQETGECISCFDDFSPRNLVKLRCHSYCKPCFRRLIANALETEAQWPPKCCLNPIDHKTCLRNISGPLSARYMQKRQEYSMPIHARYYCPVPDCGLFVAPDRANAPFRRARCKSGHLTCMDCRQAAHADAVQCVKNQDMELVQRLAADEGWRRCHRCHTMIEHRTACRHITCRCGAEFCMVCGAVWWTCSCTERQLDEIKHRARRNSERRREQEERERREMRELHTALELIARMEAEESEKLERTRAAKEARRKAQVTSSYTELMALLGEVNGFQRGVLEGQHERGRRELLVQMQTAEEGLKTKHVVRTEELREESRRKMDDKEKKLWEEYEAGTSQETPETIMDERVRLGSNRGVPEDEDYEAKGQWPQYRDGQLRQFRWAVENEQAIEEELSQAKTERILESFKVQQRELQVKIRSELRWYELVVAERARLLDELLIVELEDEIVDDDDYRWNAIVVQEHGEPGPSRCRRSSHIEKAG